MGACSEQQLTYRAVDSESTFTTMSFLIGPVSGALVAGGVRRSLMLYTVIPESFDLDLLWFLQLDRVKVCMLYNNLSQRGPSQLSRPLIERVNTEISWSLSRTRCMFRANPVPQPTCAFTEAYHPPIQT